MGYRPAGVLDAEPNPINGDYTVEVGQGTLTAVLWHKETGAVYAQATVPLPPGILDLPKAERNAKITDAARSAARIINNWGKLVDDAAEALGVPVALEPRMVIKEQL